MMHTKMLENNTLKYNPNLLMATLLIFCRLPTCLLEFLKRGLEPLYSASTPRHDDVIEERKVHPFKPPINDGCMAIERKEERQSNDGGTHHALIIIYKFLPSTAATPGEIDQL